MGSFLDIAVPAAGFAIGGLGSILNASSQNAANRLQAEQFERSFNEQRRQFEVSRRWNSEQAQVARLRSAGLNPALVFGKGSSAVSGGSPTSPGSYGAVDYSSIFNSMLQGFGLASQIDLNDAAAKQHNSAASLSDAQTVGVGIDNLYKDALNQRNIQLMDLDAQSKKWMNNLAELQSKFDTSTLRDRIRRVTYEADYQRALRDSVTITNQYLPQQLKAQINKIIAEEAAAYMSGRASLKQAHAAIMNATNQMHAFSAQYGKDDSERSRFFRESLDFLVQKRHESRANEWRQGFFEHTKEESSPFGSRSETWYDRQSQYKSYRENFKWDSDDKKFKFSFR